MTATTYPVRVDADLDTGMSRWLWLVKWLLVLPHYVVLVFLWLAFAVLSVVAFFSILLTGRYPHSVFEFNVGVLRWSWRVAYYAYGALGTDRYPPFTLHEVADYPAHLEVEYPTHLSRGLVLVKWWLLAIPHYIVVGLFVGGTGYAVRVGHDEPAVWGAGLIGLLVLVAGVVLMFSGSYPAPLFDLVLGLNRWVLRVAGYASLMTDRYPPFSLDQGGHEAVRGGTTMAPPPPPAHPGPGEGVGGPGVVDPGTGHRTSGSRESGWTAGRVIALVLGSLLVASAVGLGLPSGALAAAELGGRDNDGFIMSRPQSLGTPTYALISANLGLHTNAAPALTLASLLGDTRLTVEPRGNQAVFVGIAPTAAVGTYLRGVERDVLTGVRDGDPVLQRRGGGPPSARPETAGIWVARSSGTGDQRLAWTPQDGDWTVVVMNADGSAGIDMDASAGVEVPALGRVVWTLVGLAALLLAVGTVLVAVPLRSVSRHNASIDSDAAGGTGGAP